jgi:hypothetical protein
MIQTGDPLGTVLETQAINLKMKLMTSVLMKLLGMANNGPKPIAASFLLRTLLHFG